MRLSLALWLSVLGAAPAFAAPRVAVHPLVVLGGDARALEQSRVDFLVEAARQPIEMVSRGPVAEVLKRQPGGSCLENEGCLETLCAETGAPYALLATLVLDGPNFVMSAKVVASDGSFVKTVDTLAVPKDMMLPRAPQVQEALKKLFKQLDLGAFPTQPRIEKKPPIVEQPKVDPPQLVADAPRIEAPPIVTQPEVLVEPTPEAPRGNPTLRIAGFVVGVAAIATAVAGTVVAVGASSSAKEIAENGVVGGNARDETWVAKAVNLDRQNGLATGLLVGAGVAAAASLALVLISVDWGTGPVVLVPVNGGAVAGIAGEF